MVEARWAEQLLVPVCGRKAANEIVGDLLEGRHGHTDGLFWRTWLRILLRFLWRPFAAITATVLAEGAVLYAFSALAAPHMLTHAYMETPEMLLSVYSLLPCALCWGTTGMFLIRSGWRSRQTGIAFAAAATMTVSSFVYGRLQLRVDVLLLWGCVMLGLSARKTWRRSVLGFLGAVALTFGLFCSLGVALGTALAAALRHGAIQHVAAFDGSGRGPNAVLNAVLFAVLFGVPAMVQAWWFMRSQRMKPVEA